MTRLAVRLILAAFAIQPLLAAPASAGGTAVTGVPAPPPEPAPGDPIAQLGGRTIVYRDFTQWLRILNRPQAASICASPTARTMAMKQYFYTLILSAKGRLEKVQETQAYKDTLAVMEQEAYARVMMDENQPGTVANRFKVEAETISDSQFQAYLDGHRNEYDTPARFSIRHILVSYRGTGAPGSDRTDAAARARIAKVQDELKGGRSFADLAKAYSDDLQSRDQGGACLDMPYGRLPLEVEEAIRTQPIGIPGQPVQSIQGYHLVLVEARKPREAATLDERIRSLIRQQLVPERRARMNKDYVDQAAAQVGFRERPQPAPGQTTTPPAQ